MMIIFWLCGCILPQICSRQNLPLYRLVPLLTLLLIILTILPLILLFLLQNQLLTQDWQHYPKIILVFCRSAWPAPYPILQQFAIHQLPILNKCLLKLLSTLESWFCWLRFSWCHLQVAQSQETLLRWYLFNEQQWILHYIAFTCKKLLFLQ